VNRYSRDLAEYFSSGDLGRIYASNPIWQQQEQQAYGGTVSSVKPPLVRRIRGLFS
jgi:hypothetical protein